MRNFFFVSFEVAFIALVTFSLLSNPPLWKKASRNAAPSPAFATVQHH